MQNTIFYIFKGEKGAWFLTQTHPFFCKDLGAKLFESFCRKVFHGEFTDFPGEGNSLISAARQSQILGDIAKR